MVKQKLARKTNELFLIDPIQGFMIEGYLDENDNNLASAKSNYMSAFNLIENNFESYESFFRERRGIYLGLDLPYQITKFLKIWELLH